MCGRDPASAGESEISLAVGFPMTEGHSVFGLGGGSVPLFFAFLKRSSRIAVSI